MTPTSSSTWRSTHRFASPSRPARRSPPARDLLGALAQRPETDRRLDQARSTNDEAPEHRAHLPTSNNAMHSLMHIGWVPDDSGGGYHAQMAVLTKPKGWLGKAYMAAIKGPTSGGAPGAREEVSA